MPKIKLYAQGDYDDIELEFKKIEIIDAEDINSVIACVTDGKVIYAKKTAVVTAQLARLGQKVDTTPRCIIDGNVYVFSETKRVICQKDIDDNSVLIQNPDGECYVIKGEKFAKLYKPCDGGYQTDDSLKKFVTITENICFKAPWGEMLFAPKGSKLCIEYIQSRDIYTVTNSAFQSTYSEMKCNMEIEKN